MVMTSRSWEMRKPSICSKREHKMNLMWLSREGWDQEK
jgi:hypothetical protein